MKNLVLVTSIILMAISASAQDTLFKRNREVMVVKITEIGLDEVKYKLPGYETGPTIAISKDQLQKIVFGNGATQLITPEMTNPENYAGQKKNAIKIDFLSPMRNNLSLVYERSIRPGRSIELNLGIVGIGVGTSDWDHASGAFFRVGYKFMKTPDFYLRGMRYSHILKGSYVRPDFIFGSYSVDHSVDNSYQSTVPPYNYITNYTITRQKLTYGALHISLGKQWVFDDTFLIDLFGGLGYAVTSVSETSPNDFYTVQYGITGGGSNSPFSASGGLRVGFLIK